MKNINYLFRSLILIITLIFTSCETEDYEFGDIINPSNLVVSADIVGLNNDNPNGDGSGTVHLVAEAENAITYKFVHNGIETMSASGMITYNFSTTGLSTYDITVIAIGSAGVMTNTSISVDVLVLYSPPQELLNAMFTGSWRVQAEEFGHMGVGPADGVEAIWWEAGAFAKIDTAMYDDRYTFSPDGTLLVETFGSIFGKSSPLSADFTGDQGLTPNGDAEFEYYEAEDFTSIWTIGAPGGVEHISFSGNGFIGFYVGGNHNYQIIERSSNILYLKTVGEDTNGWFIRITNDN